MNQQANSQQSGADTRSMAEQIEAWKNKPLTTGQKRRITQRRNAAKRAAKAGQ